jgi:hypothetical protein
VYAEISYDEFERLNAQGSYDAVISVAPERLLRQTTWRVVDECVTYFAFIRDSLRHIQNEIEKRTRRENVVFSDAFWRRLILKAVGAGKLETELWDFKETLSFWHVPRGEERARAKLDFARHVASFANARGGCLVVGVTDTRQVVGVPNPGKELENKLKNAEHVLSKHLIYPRQIFHFRQVLVPGRDGASTLCIVVAIRRAGDVAAVRDEAGQYTYPVRTGTGTTNGDPAQLRAARMREDSDSFDFLEELAQFVRDN